MLLDEPTSGLDPKDGAEFLQLLRQLKDEGKAIFMSTHDIFRAKEIADRVGIMVQGNRARELTHEEIAKENLEQSYTFAMWRGMNNQKRELVYLMGFE